MGAKAKATLEAELRALVVGLQSLVGVDTFVLAGKTYSKTDLITAINTFLAISDAVVVALTQYRAAVATLRAARTGIRQLRSLLRGFLESRFGKGSPELAKYGFGSSPKTPTVEEKASALEKSKATREARHTMGPRQKKAVKGTPPNGSATPAKPASTP
jgi:hypothetical protein